MSIFTPSAVDLQSRKFSGRLTASDVDWVYRHNLAISDIFNVKNIAKIQRLTAEGIVIFLF